MASSVGRGGPGPALVPWPAKLERGDGEVLVAAHHHIAGRIAAPNPRLVATACALQDALNRLGMRASDAKGRTAPIRFEIVPDLAADVYRISVEEDVVISASEYDTFAWACATLLQLVRVDQSGLKIPRVTIEDRPDCAYRGLLVDVARNFHPLECLKQIVDLCWFYKLAFLQLHLTDDQAFTFPSRTFPKLATRGHSYTRAQLEELEAYAAARGVTLVPELEMPGHAGAAIAAMPELFKTSDRHHATLNFADARVVAALEKLIDEMLEVFPRTPYFHIGGDEADLAFVHENPHFQRALREGSTDDVHVLYCRFLRRMNEFVKSRGRRTLVWEGFAHAAIAEIPTDLTVMVYESLHHLPHCLLRDGFPVINSSWEPLYVVNDRCWPVEEIHAWDRFYWKHFLEGYPAYAGLRVDPNPNVLGAQMCAWEQSHELELPSLRERVAAFSERLWSPSNGRDFRDFAARLVRTDRRLSLLFGTERETPKR